MRIDIKQFHETFFEEAVEHLASMESALLQLEENPHDQELLNSIFRGAHSIKGASSTFGFPEIARFTHSLESLLDPMRDGKITPTRELTELLLHSTDTMKELVAAAKGDGEPPAEMEKVLAELERTLAQALPEKDKEGNGQQAEGNTEKNGEGEGRPLSDSTVSTVYQVVFKPGQDLFRQGMDPLLLLRDLSELGEMSEVEVDLSRLPDLSHLDPETCYLS